MTETLILLSFVLLYGVVIGSFLNVCILRIPEGQSIVSERSHCNHCNAKIQPYDLIPILSYLLLGGRCRNCKTKISMQYPLIEAANGILYVVVIAMKGFSPESIIYCLVISALIVLSVIDLRTNIIPFGINIVILILGLIHGALDYPHVLQYGIGFIAVSGFLYLIYLLTGGNGVGGGDIKLMAAAGLLLGWKLIILAFFIGCILGSIIHPLRMKFGGQSRVLAFGPYLSAGILITILWGNQMLLWYFGMF